jgi:hypothetical protein
MLEFPEFVQEGVYAQDFSALGISPYWIEGAHHSTSRVAQRLNQSLVFCQQTFVCPAQHGHFVR